jgi:hypothetical protein
MLMPNHIIKNSSFKYEQGHAFRLAAKGQRDFKSIQTYEELQLIIEQ